MHHTACSHQLRYQEASFGPMPAEQLCPVRWLCCIVLLLLLLLPMPCKISSRQAVLLEPVTAWLAASACIASQYSLAETGPVEFSWLTGSCWCCRPSLPAWAAPLSTHKYIDPQGTFTVLVTGGWQQVKPVPSTGILASWYDPANRGSDVIAVYAATTQAASTAELGTAQVVGEQLAAVSPGGQLQQYGSDVRSDGRQYITTRVLFTGVSAGAFGAVVDVRCSVVAERTKLTLRVSSKLANLEQNPAWASTINDIVKSFQLVL